MQAILSHQISPMNNAQRMQLHPFLFSDVDERTYDQPFYYLFMTFGLISDPNESMQRFTKFYTMVYKELILNTLNKRNKV